MKYGLWTSGVADLWERVTVWYQNSALHDAVAFLVEKFFTVELHPYEHFNFSLSAGATIRNTILALAAGLILAAFFTVYTRTKLGGFVRKLIADGCLSEDSAKTLYELGYFRDAAIRRHLARGGPLSMVVRSVAAPAENADPGELPPQKKAAKSWKNFFLPAPKNKPDFPTARFYIPEDLRIRAEIRFEKKGSDKRTLIATVIAAVIVFSLLCQLVPEILQMADNLISILAPG